VSGDLERDLEAWRRGELSLDNLVAAHGSDAEALAALHERLGRTLSAPVDGDAVWATVERGMAAGNVVQLPGRRRRHKVAVLAIAAALAVGGSALAAVGSHIGSHPDRPAGVSGLVTDPSAQPEGPSGSTPSPAASPSKDGDGSHTTTDGDSSGEDSSADSGSGSTSSDGSGSDSSGDGSSSPSGSGDTGSSDGSGSTGSDGGSPTPSGGDTSPTPSD